ncbi:MAG: M1 family aminopeptidase [Nitrospinae bacterium]|jgi:aminopeptidase N|nr:M1 family aminopeptidase [Nitrospinota bacterium]
MQSLDKIKFLKPICRLALGAFWLVITLSGSSFANPIPHHHNVMVNLDPVQKSAQIKDTLILHLKQENDFVLELFLHANFGLAEIKIPDNKDFIIETTPARNAEEDPPLTKISIRKITDHPWPEYLKIEFQYGGRIFDPQNPENTESSGEGIFLNGASYFYPQTLRQKEAPDLMTFQLTVLHPDGWKVVSQGRKISESKNGNQVVWETTDPMEEIFLIANRFKEYERQHGGILFYAYLLKEDPDLAETYFSAAKKYLDFYAKLIGPYPYPKFALIENAMQTGYGMASFTLLGSQVIRFPFILNTSYPHEILHNWWGNSVYIDPDSGNWAEGLTAYLSDHLLTELQGQGNQYRLQQLMNFLSYVNKANDFPLISFKSRTSMASQAIGYGKMLMMLHMVRLQVGDAAFLQALREFYRDNQFRHAGLSNLRQSFESASGKDLSLFFDHWTYRREAPELELISATHTFEDGQHRLQIEVQQKQSGPAFPLTLPVAVWTKGSLAPQIKQLDMTQKTLTHSFHLPDEPGKVLIDPYTEIFRKLDHEEVPPSIGQTYGYPLPSRILPIQEDFPDVLLGYHQFSLSLVEDNKSSGYLLDDAKSTPLPKGGLWIFGRKNAYAKHLQPQLEDYGVEFFEDKIVIAGESFPWEDHSFVFTVRSPGKIAGSITWVIVSSGESIPGLIRKLPHYGKYGALVFKGKQPENQLKNIWPFQPSGLMKVFHPGDYTLPPQPPLVNYTPIQTDAPVHPNF